MIYCGSCGEPAEGRFCRMCGAATADASAGYVGGPVQPTGPTQMIHGAMAMAATQQVPYPQAPLPGPGPQPGQPGSDFDALFRQPEGVVTPHSQTRLLPSVDADYRMAPPGAPMGAPSERGPFQAASSYQGGDYPPGAGNPQAAREWDEDDEPSIRKPVLLGTIGAVVAAAAVILGLLYIGSHNNAASANATSTSSANAVVGTPSPSVGDINLPAVSATSASPSASASPSQSASGNTNLPLTPGSTGKYVTYVQGRLHQLRFYHGPVNGQYDSATAQAVVQFQAAAHVNGDQAGTVGRATLTALIAAGPRPDLRPGSSDAGDIKRLQNSLNSAENAGLQVSGRYDVATVAAVARYQSSVGVQPTGFMNAQTWAALQSGSVI